MNVCITGKRTIGWVIKGESKTYDDVKKTESRMIKDKLCTIIYPNYGGKIIVNEENYSVNIC